MHTLDHDNYRIQYNPDGSGEARIINKKTDKSFDVPTGVFFAFVANQIRTKRIRDAERATDEELLGL